MIKICQNITELSESSINFPFSPLSEDESSNYAKNVDANMAHFISKKFEKSKNKISVIGRLLSHRPMVERLLEKLQRTYPLNRKMAISAK